MVYSNWRQELTEVMTDKDAAKKVTEKKVKNKIIINPQLGEAIESMGGELLEMIEMEQMQGASKTPEDGEDKSLVNKQKKINMVKKQVLLKKMQAVRQGAGADIIAHYSPEGNQIDEKKGCSHTHKGAECPVHGKKECPDIVAAEIDERTRYAKEIGKDFKTGNSSKKGGTMDGKGAFAAVRKDMIKTGGLMSSRGKAIQAQGKKKEKGAKGYKGVTPVDKIRNRLSQKRAEKPNPYRARAGESD